MGLSAKLRLSLSATAPGGDVKKTRSVRKLAKFEAEENRQRKPNLMSVAKLASSYSE